MFNDTPACDHTFTRLVHRRFAPAATARLVSDDDQIVLRAAMRNAMCMVDGARAAGLDAYREHDLGWVVAPDVSDPAVNAVRPEVQHAGLADRIPDIVATYPDHVPIAWWVMSDDGHDELGVELSNAGFELAATMPAIAGPTAAATSPPATDILVSPPASDGDWDAFVAVLRDGFGLDNATSASVTRCVRALGETEPDAPTIEALLAHRAGEPIAVGCVSHRAGVAGLSSLTTLPSARGSGAGSALVDHRLALARHRGEEVAFMFSGGNAASLYARRGFRTIGTCDVHVLVPRI